MKPLTAMLSVVEAAAFHAGRDGVVIESNAAFMQVMRCMPGDDWRLHVAQGDRAIVDALWTSLCSDGAELHPPIAFLLDGSDERYQLRIQAVLGEDGTVEGAVGTIVAEPSIKTPRWNTDPITGLPETEAARTRFGELLETGKVFAAAVILLEDDAAANELSIKEASRQLLTTIRPTDLLTSSSGGRFVLCAAGVDTMTAAIAMAERVTNALEASSLRARVGLAMSDSDAVPATLIREAEAGAYATDLGSFGFAPDEG